MSVWLSHVSIRTKLLAGLIWISVFGSGVSILVSTLGAHGDHGRARRARGSRWWRAR